MLLAVDGIPGTLDDLTLERTTDSVIILPVSQGVKSSLLHTVETMLAMLRQTEVRGLDKHRLMSVYWSHIPFEASSFEQAFIRRHVLAMEEKIKVPIRRIFVQVDKDYAFEKLAQQNTSASTHELTQHADILQKMFRYDRVVHVPPHAFETRSSRKAIFLELIRDHGPS